jgi:NAD+ kinase
MCLVAAGLADGFYLHSEVYQRALRVVDIAASALILREAGGELYDLDGKVLDMSLDLEVRANCLAAGDPSMLRWLL